MGGVIEQRLMGGVRGKQRLMGGVRGIQRLMDSVREQTVTGGVIEQTKVDG